MNQGLISRTKLQALWPVIIRDDNRVLIYRHRGCDGNFCSHFVYLVNPAEERPILVELFLEQFFEWPGFVHASMI